MSFEKIKFKYFQISSAFFIKILFFRIIHIFTLHINDIIIVQQEQIKRKLVKLYGINENKIFICNPTLNFDTNYSNIDYATQDFVLFFAFISQR